MAHNITFTYDEETRRLVVDDGDIKKVYLLSDHIGEVFNYLLQAIDDLDDQGGGGSQVQSDWAETDTTKPDFIKNKPTLASVAESGDYDDLTNKPVLATVATSGSYSDLIGVPTLATVATSGSYADLNNKPTIPVVAQAIASGDTGYATGDQVYQVLGDVESLLASI